MTTALVSIEMLGAEIKARVEAGDKALDKAEQHYIAAGIQLLGAHKRLKETREMRWSAFLFSCCKGLCQSRAYEYMAIADGRTTLSEIRAKGCERKAKYDARNKDARTSVDSVTNGMPENSGSAKRVVLPADLRRRLADIEASRCERGIIADAESRELALLQRARDILANERVVKREMADLAGTMVTRIIRDLDALTARPEDRQPENGVVSNGRNSRQMASGGA